MGANCASTMYSTTRLKDYVSEDDGAEILERSSSIIFVSDLVPST